MSDSTNQPNDLRAAVWTAVAVEFASALLIAFGDIGFDKPGGLGLSFGHFLVLSVLAFIAFIVGLIAAAWSRSPLGIGFVAAGAAFWVVATLLSG